MQEYKRNEKVYPVDDYVDREKFHEGVEHIIDNVNKKTVNDKNRMLDIINSDLKHKRNDDFSLYQNKS